jgi:hypothetical protein
MKKLILLCVVVGLLAVSLPALAGDGDVQFYAFKTISLSETFTYTENVKFSGAGLFLFDGEAWAKIQEQQELYSLNLEVDVVVTKRAQIVNGAFDNATGIANVNQSPGNMNNQANETAFSAGNNGKDNPAVAVPYQGMFCEAEVVTVQYNGILYDPVTDTRRDAHNLLRYSNNSLFDTINGSFNGFTGIANVNEAAGHLNNQGNAVAIAGGIAQPGAVSQNVVKAASDVMLAQNNAFNTLYDGNGPGETAFPGNNASDAMNNSFGNAFGVANVNQAAGSLNNQKNVVAIAFSGYSKP